MKKLILILTALPFSTMSFAQTGPGGVGNNSNIALWLDAHTMGGVSGFKVDSWTDYSGNNLHAIENTEENMPFYITNSLNGRNAIDFQSGQCLTTGANSIMDNINQFKFYVVGNMDDVNSLTIPFNVDYGSSSADAAFTGIITQSGNMDVYGRSGGSLIRADFTSATGIQAFAGEFNMNSTDLFAESDFVQEDVHPSLNRNTSTHEEFWIGGTKSNGSSNYFIDGQIGEVVVFTSTLNTAEQNIFENYLSSKYGMAATTDMYSYDGTHGLGVVGIGQEDVSNSHTNSIGNGFVRINTPSDLNNGEYLFIGHNDVAMNTLSSNTPSAMPTESRRFNRVWRAEKTGDLGSVTLIFDLNENTHFTTNPSSYRLIIDSDGDFSNATKIHTGTFNAGDHTITFTNVNLTSGEYFTLAGDSPITITSTQTGNWSSTSTWDCACVPTPFNDVNIGSGHNVTVDQDAYTDKLKVQASGVLTMNADHDLMVDDNMDVLGSVNFTDGKVIMNGFEAQTIDANGNTMTFHDLEINSESGSTVTLAPAEYVLTGTLSMERGSLSIDNTSSGILIVDSQSANTTGRIGIIKYGCSITGNVRVLRKLPAGNAGWRNLASPISNATLSDWDEGLIISGDGFPDGCAAIGQDPCYYSVKQWINGVTTDITSITAPLEVGMGYEIYVGDNEITYDGGTAIVEGALNSNSDIQVSVDWGWNTMGNPYASPILFPNIDRNHVDNYFYIYDAATGGYQWYDGLTNTSSIPSLANGLIAAGQGFWTYDYGTLTYDQYDKVDQNGVFIKAAEKEDLSMYLKLSENNSTYSSTISLQENSMCEDGFDTIRDMRKLITGHEKAPGFAFNTDVDFLSKNWINSKVETKSFDLYTEFKNEGYYTIEGLNISAFDHYQSIKLYDKLNEEYIDLKKEPSVVIYSTAGEHDRFTLVLSNEVSADEYSHATASVEELDNLTITQMGNIIRIDSEEDLGSNVLVQLFSVTGQEVAFSENMTIQSGSTSIELPSHNTGMYILNIQGEHHQISKKLVF